MSGSGFSDDRLRGALAEIAEAAGEGRDCPQADRLWLSARRELDPAENEAVLLHLARCPACSLAWRVAQDMGPRSAGATVGPVETRSRNRLWIALAAAAVLVVALGLGIVFRPGPAGEAGTVYRTQEGAWLVSSLEEDAALPRRHFVLRWAAGPEGTLYDVLVTSETLEPLAEGVSLEAAELVVPAESLEGLAPGSRVLWQVLARLPDGRTVESEAFTARVE
jgi:hypothetical protein